jgi:hypothetical protein
VFLLDVWGQPAHPPPPPHHLYSTPAVAIAAAFTVLFGICVGLGIVVGADRIIANIYKHKYFFFLFFLSCLSHFQ